MNNELIKNIDALAVNYISLKTIKQEEIHKNNPIVKYYNDNIMNNHMEHMSNFFESLMDKDGNIPPDTVEDNKDDFFNKFFEVDNFNEDLYKKLFTSNNDVELSNSAIQEILEYSYKLYADLDNIDTSSDKNILHTISMLFGDDFDKNEIINRIKTDFSNSFLYIIYNVNINNDKIKHIKSRIIGKELNNAIKNEDYLKAAELKTKLDNLLN